MIEQFGKNLALPTETPERHAMALAAEKAHGKPFWDLVKERAAAGVTIKQTARELGWPNASFRRLLSVHGMLRAFSGTYTQVLHTADGVKASSRAHAVRRGLSPGLVQGRLKRGHDIETALLTPAEFAKIEKPAEDELAAARLVATQYYGLNDHPACFRPEDWEAWIACADLPASFCVDCGPEYEKRMTREGRCALVNLPEARQNRIRGLRNE